jgi:hypothetical protein
MEAELPGHRFVATVALLLSSSLAAQGIESVPGEGVFSPIALARAVARLAPPRSARADADWSRVLGLPAGQSVIVQADGAPSAVRYFVSADQSTIFLLNLSDPSLSETARRACIQLATNAPQRILGAMRGEIGGFGRLALHDGGVFFDDRRVTDLVAIVQAIPQPRVIEIIRYVPGRHTPVIVGGLLLAAGLGLNIATRGRTVGGEPDITNGMLIGAGLILTGGLVVAVGEHSAHTTSEKIYQR